MSTQSAVIATVLNKEYGSNPYPTLINQINKAIATTQEDLSALKANLQVLLYQNYPHSRTVEETATQLLVALGFTISNFS